MYGTRETKNPNDFENILVVQGLLHPISILILDLSIPDAQRILDLEAILQSDFASDYGHAAKEFPFHDALWTCSTLFSSTTTKVGHKRIFLFTNEDNPNPSDAYIRSQNIQRAKDLSELGIELELFPMNKKSESFDPSKFYVVGKFQFLCLTGRT